MDDHYNILREIFTNKSDAVIQNVIRIILDNADDFSSEEQLEAMINLLSETGTLDTNCSGPFEEAVGFNAHSSEDPITVTLKRLLDIFPDADPSYLEQQAPQLTQDETLLEDFINKNVETRDYPKLEDYLRKRDELSEMDKYLSRFSVHDFLLEFPDPIKYFNDPNRKHAFNALEENDNIVAEKEFALICLNNLFPYLRKMDIEKLFKKTKYNIVAAHKKLKTIPRAFKTPRSPTKIPDISIKNMYLLQEIAYVRHEKEFRNIQKEREENYRIAKNLRLLETCNCCYGEDLIPEDCFFCKGGCVFCRECIRKSAEIAYSEAKTEFKCLADCGNDFSLRTLQMVLNPKTFINLVHAIQMQEVQQADIPGLEYCPLCSNWAMIPDPDDKIFHCEACKKESCRECKHEAHVPKRCNEIEYDEDVKMRTYIENKMTEALVRKCYKCGAKFVKTHGCNKMTCSCGARMCYLCGAAITDYSHFSDAGCPLHTNDEEIHRANVIKGAQAAKTELGVDIDPTKLKFDPTRNF